MNTKKKNPNALSKKMQINFHPRQMEQIEHVQTVHCHTSVAETVRYLVTRGLLEETTKQSMVDLVKTQKQLVELMKNPELPLPKELLSEALDD